MIANTQLNTDMKFKLIRYSRFRESVKKAKQREYSGLVFRSIFTKTCCCVLSRYDTVIYSMSFVGRFVLLISLTQTAYFSMTFFLDSVDPIPSRSVENSTLNIWIE